MKRKWFLVLGNVILVAIVATLMLLCKKFTSTYSILAFVFMLITLFVPSIYVIINNINYKIKKELINIKSPSVIVTFGFIVVNLIACIIMLSVNNLISKTFWITEMIIIGIYVILLCVIFAVYPNCCDKEQLADKKVKIKKDNNKKG